MRIRMILKRDSPMILGNRLNKLEDDFQLRLRQLKDLLSGRALSKQKPKFDTVIVPVAWRLPRYSNNLVEQLV